MTNTHPPTCWAGAAAAKEIRKKRSASWHRGERKASKAGDLLANAEDLTKFSSTVFRNVDVDSTRFVEFGELRVCLEEICALFGLEKPSQEDVETSMKDLDKDMNGTVSVSEFRHIMTTMGEKYTEEEFRDLIQGIDDNGVIHYEKFVMKMLAPFTEHGNPEDMI